MYKKIALDALIMSQTRAGIGNYQYNLINKLRSAPYKFDVFVSREGLIEPSENMNVIVKSFCSSSKNRLLYQALGFAKELNRGNYDLVHFMDYMTPIPHINAPFAVTVHDISFCTGDGYFTKSAALFKKTMLPRALSRSGGIITVSEFTKSEILKYFPKTDGEKISPVHLGIDSEMCPEGMLQSGIKLPFVLFVGTVEPRKNIVSLIKSMELLWDIGKICDLVIAGKFGWMYDEILNYAKNSRFSDNIKFTGFVSDSELEALYKSASVFAFPSKYEGFGFPPLEAMRRNLAVVSSGTASLPEVLENGAMLANSISDFAEKIGGLLGDSEEKRQLIARGKAQSEKFTWQKTAEKTINAYEKILRGER